MFQKSSSRLLDDPQVQRFLQALVGDRFGPEGPDSEVDLASIERWAQDGGRTVARGLCELSANQQAADWEEPRPCPDCQRPCRGAIETRELRTRDGPIRIQEIRCSCPHCRRVFFPQETGATVDSPRLQPGSVDGGHHRRHGRRFV